MYRTVFVDKYPVTTNHDRYKFGSCKDIYAIQIITERLRRESGGTYPSFEINLIFKDCERLNIMDSGDRKAVEYSVKMMGSHLNIPVWKASY